MRPAWRTTALVRVLAVLLLLLGSAGAAAAHSPGATTALAMAAATPLRQVDWEPVLASEPGVTYADEPLFPGSPLRTHVSLQVGDDEVSGYPLFDEIDYGDIDGDDAEEAVIPLFSGGTAGIIGLLLYREAPDRPRLVLARRGYKLGTNIEDGRLVIYEPSYVGFEPNCCPSATTVATYRLVGDHLEQQTFEVEPNAAQEVTVHGFYDALSRGDFAAAYDFYSPALKAANPFEEWRAVYGDTVTLEVATRPGPTPNQVEIDLTATDPAPDGETVERRFAGTWTLVWSPTERRWLLDEAQIAPAWPAADRSTTPAGSARCGRRPGT